MKKRREFFGGVLAGVPIALGYLSVSFAFGISAVRAGLSCLEASAISLSCLTSAGQVAGVDIIASGGTLLEMAAVQFTINLRYALMGISLSQNLHKSFTLPHRLIAAYGITDEIFAVCSVREQPLTPAFMYGAVMISTAGWITGTFVGAFAGSALPEAVTSALGIVIYGMFIAIIVPAAKKNAGVLFAALLAAAVSVGCRHFAPKISSGFTVIICALAASAAAAALFPRADEEEQVSGE